MKVVEYLLLKFLVCVFLCCSMVLCGCYSQSTIARDVSAPDDEPVVFTLNNGSNVDSKPGEHTRIDNGYQVIGNVFNDGRALGRFEGVVPDSDIEKISIKQVNAARTALGVVYCAVGFMLVVSILIAAQGGMSIAH